MAITLFDDITDEISNFGLSDVVSAYKGYEKTSQEQADKEKKDPQNYDRINQGVKPLTVGGIDNKMLVYGLGALVLFLVVKG